MRVLHLVNTLSAGGAELLSLRHHLKRRGVEVAAAYLQKQVKGSQLLRSAFEKEEALFFSFKGRQAVPPVLANCIGLPPPGRYLVVNRSLPVHEGFDVIKDIK